VLYNQCNLAERVCLAAEKGRKEVPIHTAIETGGLFGLSIALSLRAESSNAHLIE
jgi:hypothetical protein